jgi:hypothetical protein
MDAGIHPAMLADHAPAPAGSILLPLPRLARGRDAVPACAEAGAIPLEQVSSLLWNGLGSRRRVHGRAALPPRVGQPLQVYALLPAGAYRYEPEEHRLDLVAPSDLRALISGAGGRPAALHLLYVTIEGSRGNDAWEECGRLAVDDAGHVAERVAARCGEQGLVASSTRHVAPRVRAALRLVPRQHVALAQRVDRPAQSAC